MIQLSYQPAFDPFHAAWRLLRLRQDVLPETALPEDHVRILDFYLLFPFRLDAMRLKATHRRFRKLAAAYSEQRPYGELPDDRTLFNRMQSIQTAAFDTLVSKELFDLPEYERGCILATFATLPSDLQGRVSEINEAQSDLVEFLRALATEYELLGPDGLKDRTGLMEHLYDAA